MEQEFLTVAEVAELLKVHPNTVRSMIKSGELEHYRVGNQIRVKASAIESLRVPAADPDGSQEPKES